MPIYSMPTYPMPSDKRSIGIVGHPRAAAYAASKAGLNGLTRTLALELAATVWAHAVAQGHRAPAA